MALGALVALDIEGGGRFALSGEHHDLVAPQDLPHEHVIAACQDWRQFARLVVGRDRKMTRSELQLLQASWVARAGLLQGDDLQRLVWLVRTFRAELEYDLRRQLGLSLGELWRGRRWRELLGYVDHLPRIAYCQ